MARSSRFAARDPFLAFHILIDVEITEYGDSTGLRSKRRVNGTLFGWHWIAQRHALSRGASYERRCDY